MSILFKSLIPVSRYLKFNSTTAPTTSTTTPQNYKFIMTEGKIDADYEPGSNSVVFVTVPEEQLAKELAGGLLQEKLAACVNIIPKIASMYVWEGKVVEDNELLMMIKTRTNRVADLTKYVVSHHKYSVPEVISIPIMSGSNPYLSWITENVPDKS